MVLILPTLLYFIMVQFVQPLGDYMFSSVGALTIDDLESLQASDFFVQIFNTTFSTLIASILINDTPTSLESRRVKKFLKDNKVADSNFGISYFIVFRLLLRFYELSGLKA